MTSANRRKPCQCSLETALVMEIKGFGFYRHMGMKLRKAYIQEQHVMQVGLEEYGLQKEEMPPCVNCDPAVFAFCATTGHECKIFELYSTSGKTGKHVCFLRMENIKKKRPSMECYCSEDERTLSDPQSHAQAAAKRRAKGCYDKKLQCVPSGL